MTERLQKIIASRGVASRRQAEAMILDGRVSCNGKTAHLGDSADAEKDSILLDGKPLPGLEARVYIMLNKPRGFVTTLSDEKGRRNAAELVKGCGIRVYPVGRLDMDSEGLLIFTNDGEFANYLMHPGHEVNKTYRVIVSGCSEAGIEKLRQPIVLDGYRIRKPDVVLVRKDPNRDRAEIDITIHEGRNRQVRRMCAMAGMHVERLIRIQEGNLLLGTLPKGSWRYLTENEVQMLRK